MTREERWLEEHLASAQAVNKKLHAVVTWVENAGVPTEESPTRGGQHEDSGILSDRLVSIKDCIDFAGLPTSNGAPGPYRVPEESATVVERVLRDGAKIIAKDNLHDWCYGGTTQNPFTGGCRNPWDLERIPGGSSGGSAASVASGISEIALGTDSGGSVRMPAALCGVFGLRPTVGAVPNDGVLRASLNLDCVGVIARNTSDLERGFRSIRGFTPRDVQTTAVRGIGCPRVEDVAVRALQLGIPEQFFASWTEAGVAARFEEALASLQAYGLTLKNVTLPDRLQAWEAASELAAAGIATLHSERLELQPESIAPETAERMRRGLSVSTHTLIRDEMLLQEWSGQVRLALQEVDILVTPTTPCAAPAASGGRGMVQTTTRLTAFTLPFSPVGGPALSIPIGLTSEGLPVGLQLVGNAFAEHQLLAVAQVWEALNDFQLIRPPLHV